MTFLVTYDFSTLERCLFELGEVIAMPSTMVPSIICAAEDEGLAGLRALVNSQENVSGAEILREQAGTRTIYCKLN